MNKTYPLHVAGLVRNLPICRVSDSLYIGAFVIFGDVELTECCARDLLKIAPAHDVIITAESKGIPLAYEMARQSGVNRYLIARKVPKLYMKNVFSVKVNSITTEKEQILCIDQDDADFMRGKRVLIVDDVISTGESLKAVETLVNAAGGRAVGLSGEDAGLFLARRRGAVVDGVEVDVGLVGDIPAVDEKEYPTRLGAEGMVQLAAGSDLVVVRILGVRRQYEEVLAPLLAGPAPVVVLGGEQVPDAELMELSTVPMGVATEAHGYLAQGGPDNLVQLHRFLSDTVLLTGEGFAPPVELPAWGVLERDAVDVDGPTVAVLYYRAQQLAGNTAYVEALCTAIEDAGGRALPVFTASLRTVEPGLVELLRTAIKQFAKRQTTWFRRDKDIQWLDMAGDPFAEACEKIDRFLAE